MLFFKIISPRNAFVIRYKSRFVDVVTEIIPDAPKGHVYDTKPIKFTLQKGKVYNWCVCGLSHSQPFCDLSHSRFKTKFLPLRFVANENKDVWLCNCKQTSRAPYCDSTHKKLNLTKPTVTTS
ncbi:unnamed protein product [Gordionus sp. m RMFG-2023]